MTAENSLHDDDRLPVKMLNDRILVKLGDAEGERRSSGGILIPATAQVGKRLTWAEIVAVGPNVRTIESGDQVLFNPEDRYEVEVNGTDYIVLANAISTPLPRNASMRVPPACISEPHACDVLSRPQGCRGARSSAQRYSLSNCPASESNRSSRA